MSDKNWIKEKIQSYYSWLCDNTVISHDDLTDWYAVETPFLGLSNDCIEVFIKKEGTRILLSDDGETLLNLKMHGVDVSRSNIRRSILKSIELNFAVSIINGEITAEATESDFPNRKHDLLQAIQQVSDLRLTAKHEVASIFAEDFKAYLDSKDVIYTPGFRLPGKSGLMFYYDFQIAGKTSETIIRTFNQLRQANVAEVLFGLEDIRENRESISGKRLKNVVVVNDTERKVKNEYISALNDYGCNALLWSQKEKEWDVRSLIPA